MSNMWRACVWTVLLGLAPAAVAGERVTIPALDGGLQLPGIWFPAATSERRPAVITLHGCGGMLNEQGEIGAGYVREASYFNSEGIHVLALDSFTPRGQKSICEIRNAERAVNETDRRADVFAAIQWLARQGQVDPSRIVVVGRSHGGQTVLRLVDRSDPWVKAQPLQPRAAVAFYPGCAAFTRQQGYEISVPLPIMIGELDNWTPAANCVRLRDQLQRGQEDLALELVVYPGSYHGFDGTVPVRVRENLPNLKAGQAIAGGNPEARVQSHRRMFEFVSVQVRAPLRLSHEQRMRDHHYAVPPATGFAAIDNAAAVPLGERGQARYRQFLALGAPKAFVITEKRGWYTSAEDPAAMAIAFGHCAKAGVKCWLYAVDDRVVWAADASRRVDASALRRVAR